MLDYSSLRGLIKI